MDVTAFVLCRNCQRGLVMYTSRKLNVKSWLPVILSSNVHPRLFSMSAATFQKGIRPGHLKKNNLQRKLPQSTRANVKLRNKSPVNSLKTSVSEPDITELHAQETEPQDQLNSNHLIDDSEERHTIILETGLEKGVDKKISSAADTVIAQVTPCPIEPKDGNKDEKEIVVEEIWRRQKTKLSELPSLYLQLSKSRLTSLVVISALAGYGMAPGTFDILNCALMAGGTFLTSCSANTTNQFFEVPYDSQMARTRNRVLVRGLLSPLHAVGFASVVGVVGVGTLYHMVNPLAAGIAASTWLLYVAAYTPLKRVSIVNTWVGALVGALPPMIGWAACTGGLDYGAVLMAGFLYCWQFPHFNALSWNLRSDYSRGGYSMMATTDPDLCRRVALRHCLGLIGLSTLAPVLDLTTWTFAVDSLPLNLCFSYLAWRFYEDADSKSARKLFLFSLLHLPVLMLLLLISKKDLHPEPKKTSITVVAEEMEC